MSSDTPTSEPLETSIAPWLSVRGGARAGTVRMILTVEDLDAVFAREIGRPLPHGG
jgi:hypothetical protein